MQLCSLIGFRLQLQMYFYSYFIASVTKYRYSCSGEPVIRSFQQGDTRRATSQLLSLNLTPHPLLSGALITTPVLYFIAHLLSKCFTMGMYVSCCWVGILPLGRDDSVSHSFKHLLSCFVGWELHIYFVLNYVYIIMYYSFCCAKATILREIEMD